MKSIKEMSDLNVFNVAEESTRSYN